jgi:ectoine hydroxylase-related dioxygenase (phytanoyl-CoA dioxygenase family)
LEVPDTWGGFLISFPRVPPGPWTVAAEGWHWDGDVWGSRDALNGLFIFTFLSDVRPAGGGTLGLAGSHRLISRFLHALAPEDRPKHAALIKRFGQSHPYLAELTGGSPEGTNRAAKFMGGTADLDGLPARVVEMTGGPGDAILCHPNIFHAVSLNCADVPRFMRVKAVGRLRPGS